ncbi:hypothetical protein ACWGOE_09005 [Leucobacter chromiiresistens]
MSDRIDLRIPGDASAMYEMGEWFDRRLGTAIDEMVGRLTRTQSDVQYSWEGESMEAFQTATSVHAIELDALPGYLARVRQTLEAFADRLTRGRGHFAGYAEEAAAAGMAVDGVEYISPPEPPLDVASTGSLTPAAEREAASARRAYESAALLFEEIRGLVDDWNADTLEWIDTYFDPLVEQLESFEKIRGLTDYFALNGFTLADVLLAAADQSAKTILGSFRDQQTRLQGEHDEHRRNARSGDPARRSLADEYEATREQANRTATERAARHASWLDPAAKALRAAGPISDLVKSGVALADGEPPSTVGAGFAGALAGAGAGGKVGAWVGAQAALFMPAAAAPGSVLGGTAGALFGGAAGSGLGQGAWEAALPLKVRDALDEGLRGRFTGQYRLVRQVLQDDAPGGVP